MLADALNAIIDAEHFDEADLEWTVNDLGRPRQAGYKHAAPPDDRPQVSTAHSADAAEPRASKRRAGQLTSALHALPWDSQDSQLSSTTLHAHATGVPCCCYASNWALGNAVAVWDADIMPDDCAIDIIICSRLHLVDPARCIQPVLQFLQQRR